MALKRDAAPAERHRLVNDMPEVSAVLRRLGRDYAYVLPGLPIAVFSFSLLMTLLTASLVTLVVWVGALLLPLTLVVATGFAELSRSRLRRWGREPGVVGYRQSGQGLVGKLSLVADPRRWLDLVFEMLIALPLRLLSWVIAVAWTALGLGGVSYFLWSRFLPEDDQVIQLLHFSVSQALPVGETQQYLFESGLMVLVGLGALAALPLVIHGLARLDALLTGVLLSAGSARTAWDAESQAGAGPQVTRSFSGRAWSRIGSGFAAVVLLAVGWPVTAVAYDVDVALAMLLVTAHCAAITVTLRWAWSGLGLSLAASGGIMLSTAASSAVWPWPVTTLLTQCAVLIVAALARPWYYAAAAWSVGAAMTVVALLSAAPGVPPGMMANGVVFVSVGALVVVLGALARLGIRNAGRLEEATRSSAEQGRRRHELEERNRIARELHDVVAHSMSVISVQASTAQYRHPAMDDDARVEFKEIADSSRQALSEMRMLLSILRGGDEARIAPEPGIEDISALIESTRAAGTRIRHGPADEQLKNLSVSSSTGLIAYRTVQEALANALRHSPGAAIDVEVAAGQDAHEQPLLRLVVVNEASPEEIVDPAPGAGLGLEGIRERVEAIGGSVEAGPTEHGGFAVRASLPV